MRRKFIALFVGLLYILMIHNPITPVKNHEVLYHYYIDNFFSETAATNAVTAIYLNYRVYDTLFETLLLLVSVIGIIYFSRHAGDY